MSEPATPIEGETTVVTDPKTNANPTPVATPAVDTGEVEKLRKEKEQAEMQANMLRNQLKEKEDAEAAARTKQLEEQNKFKDLYEQTQAKLRETETAIETAQKAAEVKTATDKLFADYPEQVKVIAEETGLSLADTDEDTIAAFKTKLDKLTPMVSGGKVTPNNPGVATPVTEVTNNDIAAMMNDPKKLEEYFRKNSKGIGQMVRPQA